MTESSTAPAGTRYAIDPGGSRITILGYATGLLSAVGHDPVIAAREMQGEASLAPDNSAVMGLRLTIATPSLVVQNDVSDKDRHEIERAMHDDVLEIAKYPEIVFEASGGLTENPNGRLRVEVDGKLTLHGVTRHQRVSAQLFQVGDTLRAQGKWTLRQSDFGIKPFSSIGGTLKIKDELACTFDLLARKTS